MLGNVDAAAAQRHGADAVKGRRLVQRDKRIGIVPVAAGLAVPVDQRDVRVGLVDQGIDEGQAGGAAADDQVVGCNRFQGVSTGLWGRPMMPSARRCASARCSQSGCVAVPAKPGPGGALGPDSGLFTRPAG